jgi:ATP-dependent DNA helicase RecG
LASLFFRAGYIEAWGRGTISIVQECRENGLLAPSFNEQFGGFTISFHKPMQITPPDTPPDTPPVTPPVKQLLIALTDAMSREELQSALRITNKKYFLVNYVKPAIVAGLIEMTIPDKPNSKYQKYRLTRKGLSRQ